MVLKKKRYKYEARKIGIETVGIYLVLRKSTRGRGSLPYDQA